MTHYDILGVSKNATQDEIRKAYIKLVKQYHPDLYKGDKVYAEKKTKEINNAYDVLSDEEARRQYDLEIAPPEPTVSYQYTSPKYDDVGPTYNTIYEEILRSYRKKYNDYFDSRNNASSSYGYYQTKREAERSKRRAAYDNKRYETINQLYNNWDLNSGVKVSLLIIMVFLISLFILIGSYVQTIKIANYNSVPSDYGHAIVSKTDEEIEQEKERTKQEAKMIEEYLRTYYNQELEADENFKLENGIYDLISPEKLMYIYQYYYASEYTFDEFIDYMNTNVLVED